MLKLYEYFEDEKNVYLVTEICRGGELFDKIIEEEFFSELLTNNKELFEAV